MCKSATSNHCVISIVALYIQTRSMTKVARY
jgi:hypothetical protein